MKHNVAKHQKTHKPENEVTLCVINNGLTRPTELCDVPIFNAVLTLLAIRLFIQFFQIFKVACQPSTRQASKEERTAGKEEKNNLFKKWKKLFDLKECSVGLERL